MASGKACEYLLFAICQALGAEGLYNLIMSDCDGLLTQMKIQETFQQIVLLWPSAFVGLLFSLKEWDEITFLYCFTYYYE